jgi:hypothetical protein
MIVDAALKCVIDVDILESSYLDFGKGFCFKMFSIRN